MNRTLPYILPCSLVMLALSSGASRAATLIFERELTVDRSINIFTTEAFSLKFVFSDTFSPSSSSTVLSAPTSITPSSVGTKFVWDNVNNDPDFSEVAARLSDTLNQAIRIVLTEIASNRPEERGFLENLFFTGLSKPGNPGLAGKQVERIEATVTKFQLLPPGTSGSAASSSGPPVDLRVQFAVYVPEPSTLAGGAYILAIAAVTALRRRRGVAMAA